MLASLPTLTARPPLSHRRGSGRTLALAQIKPQLHCKPVTGQTHMKSRSTSETSFSLSKSTAPGRTTGMSGTEGEARSYLARSQLTRRYVVQAVSLASLMPTALSTHDASPFPRPEPSVLIGIFPAACVHVRPDSSVDDGSLALAYEAAVRKAPGHDHTALSTGPSWADGMTAVKEEDEAGGVSEPDGDEAGQGGSTPAVIDIPSDTRHASSGPKSLDMDGKTPAEEGKDQPPLPRLTAGDSTVAGQSAPLVDEIACAIREWYTRLPTYLANREYRLFNTVIQHIDALSLGRRQMLSQTLSLDELVQVKRECVGRLVKCNVAQGLEVIVRSLEDGSVMVVDKDRAYAGASWVRGVPCYVYQIQVCRACD